MEDKDTLSASAGILTAKPTRITVDVYPKTGLERLLVKLKLRPTQQTYELRPVLVGNMYRIAGVVNQMPLNSLTGSLDSLQQAVADHLDKVIYIVAVGLQNNRHEPKKALLDTIRNEFTATDIALVMQRIMDQLNLKDFLSSIVLAKGMNILAKASPTEETEIIADSTTLGN